MKNKKTRKNWKEYGKHGEKICWIPKNSKSQNRQPG
jgi:hypothetical protein